MKQINRGFVNDIEHCLAEAQQIANPNIRHPFRKVFRHLAGDDTTGLVAYAIWRGRSRILSILSRAPDYLQSGASNSRASRT